MKKIVLSALALAAASVALPAAAQDYGRNPHNDRGPRYEQPVRWESIVQRKYNLDRRIDQGVRTGQLSRRDATRLRSEFNSLLRLEANYRRGGLTAWERNDLDRRFDRLSANIRYERRDRDNRRG